MQPSGSQSRASIPSASLAGGVVARSAAAVDVTITPAFETNALISPAVTTDSARLLTPPAALSDHPRAISAARITTRRETGYEGFVKPVIDRTFACVLLIVLLPLLLVVAGMVALSLGWPILLRQRRVGRHGETFVLHKFRTMQPDRRLADVDHEGGDRRRTHKHPDDPRLTAVGRTLRKWSLDELPQLWDVLTGKLSLVGPRPELERNRRELRALAARPARGEAGLDRSLAGQGARRRRDARTYRSRYRICAERHVAKRLEDHAPYHPGDSRSKGLLILAGKGY